MEHKCIECSGWFDCFDSPECLHGPIYFCGECLDKMIEGADLIATMLGADDA